MVYKLKPKLKLPSPFYDINEAIVFFSLASFFILALRELPFSTHCWYRGTHCTESTKPPNFLAFSKICWTNPQCVASKSTLYQRPWLFTIPQCRAWPAAVVRSKGLWVICIWRLHMGFVQVVKTEKKIDILWLRQALYKKVSDRMKDWKARRSVAEHKRVKVNILRVNF